MSHVCSVDACNGLTRYGRDGLCKKHAEEVTGSRTCTKCLTDLPLNQFHKNRTACKACRSAHMATYYQENAEEKRRLMREHRRNNLETVRANDNARYYRNPEKRRELARAHSQIRRARKVEADIDRGISQLSLRKLHGDHCNLCGALMVFGSFPRGDYQPRLASVEHIIPLSKGGTHTWGNVTLTCLQCNISRGTKEFQGVDVTWRQLGAHASSQHVTE